METCLGCCRDCSALHHTENYFNTPALLCVQTLESGVCTRGRYLQLATDWFTVPR
jgi:hypothetical protein